MPPPTHPDIVIAPVVDVPGIWGGVMGVAVCANTFAHAVSARKPNNGRFMTFSLTS